MSFIVVIENALKLSKTFIIMGEEESKGFFQKYYFHPILYNEFFAFLDYMGKGSSH